MSYLMPVYKSRDPAITQRPPSTSLLAIDSEDRFTDYSGARAVSRVGYNVLNATPYNFTISKAESLLNGFLTRLAVTEINMPWAIPNINIKTNTIQWSAQVGSAPVTTGVITLYTGFYTPSQLAAAFQTAVRFATGINTFTITYGNTLSAQGNTPSFAYRTGTPGTDIAFAPMPYNTTVYPYNSNTKQLFDLLGFINASNSILAEFAIQNRFTFCQSFRYVDVVANVLTYNQSLKDTMSQAIARDSLCRIYLGDANLPGNVDPSAPGFCPPGCAPFTIYRNFATPKQIQWLGNQPVPGKLEFQVYDDTGDLLSNAIGADGEYLDWSMTLLVSEN